LAFEQNSDSLSSFIIDANILDKVFFEKYG